MLNEKCTKYVNCFVNSQIPIKISIDISGFLLFRASGKQTGALKPNCRLTSLCCLAAATYNNWLPACPGIPFGGKRSYGYRYHR